MNIKNELPSYSESLFHKENSFCNKENCMKFIKHQLTWKVFLIIFVFIGFTTSIILFSKYSQSSNQYLCTYNGTICSTNYNVVCQINGNSVNKFLTINPCTNFTTYCNVYLYTKCSESNNELFTSTDTSCKNSIYLGIAIPLIALSGIITMAFIFYLIIFKSYEMMFR